eukprot:TRINITY_DN487_c0_g1_i3.p1 TRINITY_DN487_c0_g1~~TRINITY_DN487_c0_g1_i3.p1  ORF type:complete len:742 (-),score=143.31 TRINITY_DN487_c0_g1_i3:99-2324(-)
MFSVTLCDSIKSLQYNKTSLVESKLKQIFPNATGGLICDNCIVDFDDSGKLDLTPFCGKIIEVVTNEYVDTETAKRLEMKVDENRKLIEKNRVLAERDNQKIERAFGIVMSQTYTTLANLRTFVSHQYFSTEIPTVIQYWKILEVLERPGENESVQAYQTRIFQKLNFTFNVNEIDIEMGKFAFPTTYDNSKVVYAYNVLKGDSETRIVEMEKGGSLDLSGIFSEPEIEGHMCILSQSKNIFRGRQKGAPAGLIMRKGYPINAFHVLAIWNNGRTKNEEFSTHDKSKLYGFAKQVLYNQPKREFIFGVLFDGLYFQVFKFKKEWDENDNEYKIVYRECPILIFNKDGLGVFISMLQSPEEELGYENTVFQDTKNNVYKIQSVLGTGSSAVVYSSKLGNELFAIKHFTGIEGFRHERKMLKYCEDKNVPNLIKYVGEDTQNNALILSPVGKHFFRKSFDFLDDFFGSESTENPEEFFEFNIEHLRQLIDTVELMHKSGVIHRDIRFANIHLNPENNKIFLSDFGCAHMVSQGYALFMGYRIFASPKVLEAYEKSRMYKPQPSDDLEAIVKLFWVSFNFLKFERIRGTKNNEKICKFWEYELSAPFWKSALEIVQKHDHQMLKKHLSSFVLVCSPQSSIDIHFSVADRREKSNLMLYPETFSQKLQEESKQKGEEKGKTTDTPVIVKEKGKRGRKKKVVDPDGTPQLKRKVIEKQESPTLRLSKRSRQPTNFYIVEQKYFNQI